MAKTAKQTTARTAQNAAQNIAKNAAKTSAKNAPQKPASREAAAKNEPATAASRTAPRVSLIIPCYNVADYVERALQSAFSQTLADMEIIIIDDGSTDDTASKIEHFLATQNGENAARAANPARAASGKVFQFLRKPNGGYAAAVNLGLKHARGEFVAILESDDFVSAEYYETLFLQAREKGADAAFYTSNLENRAHYALLVQDGYFDKTLNRAADAPLTFAQMRLLSGCVGICNAIYRREFLAQNGLELNENVRAYHDISFVASFFAFAPKVALVLGARYFYTRGREFQSVNDVRRFAQICPAVQGGVEFLLAHGGDANVSATMPFVLGYYLGHLMMYLARANDFKALDAAAEIRAYTELLLAQLAAQGLTATISQLTFDRLAKFEFDTKSTKVSAPPQLKANFENLPLLNDFMREGSDFEEILPYAELRLLKFQAQGFSRAFYGAVESDLWYLLNLPRNNGKPNATKIITDVLQNFLKSVSANFIVTAHPKLFAYIALLLEGVVDELTLPAMTEIRGDGQDFLEWFGGGAVRTNSNLSQITRKINEHFAANEREFLDFIAGRSVMVVGNAPCELGREKGALIDSFDVVVRFNNFEISGFERDYGSKTNVWAVTPAYETIKFRELGGFDFVVSCDAIGYQDLWRRTLLAQFALAGVRFFRIGAHEFMRMTNIRTMSLGLVVVLYLLKHKNALKSLNVCGFSLAEQENGIQRYFKDAVSGKVLPVHRWSKEAKVLRELVESGGIKQC